MPSLSERIREWLRGNTRSNESDTDRDGFLSYSGEYHAVAVGAAFGLISAVTGNPVITGFLALVIMGKSKVSNAHLRHSAKEAAYSGGAFVVCYVVGSLL